MKKKKKLIRFLSRIEEVTSSKPAQRVFKAAEDTLNVIDKVKNGNPAAKIAAGLKAIDIATRVISLTDKDDRVQLYIKTHKLRAQKDSALKSMLESHFLSETPVAANKEQGKLLIRLEVSPGNYIYKEEATHGHSDWDADKLFYIDDSFSLEGYYKYLHHHLGKYVAVTNKNSVSRSVGWSSNKLSIRSMSIPTTSILTNEKIMEALKNDFNHKGRSCVLFGPPGTGKTTHVYCLAKHFDSMVLKFDIEALNSPQASLIVVETISALKPSIALFDDLDRIDNAQRTLAVFEEIKACSPDTLVLATCNDIAKMPKALKRPGRFDRFLMMGPPEGKEFDNIMNYFSKNKGIQVSKVDKKKLEGQSHAYIKEFWDRLEIDGSVDIDRMINEFKERQ